MQANVNFLEQQKAKSDLNAVLYIDVIKESMPSI